MAEVEAGLNCEARTRKPLLQLLREGGFQYSGSFSLSFIMITSAGVRDGGPGGGISVAGKLVSTRAQLSWARMPVTEAAPRTWSLTCPLLAHQ